MKLLFRYFGYIFYRAYLWEGKRRVRESARVGNALLYVSFLLSFYALAIVAGVDSILHGSMFGPGKNGALVFAFICVVCFYFLPIFALRSNDRYKRIIKEFSSISETKWQSRVREILIFLNFIFAFILTVVLVVFGR